MSVQSVPGNNLVQGTQLLAEVDHLSFRVLDNGVQAQGLSKTNRERYLIKVQFDNGRQAAFRCESKSLKNAFEIIEMVGQQTKDMNSAQLDRFFTKMQGKRIWMDSKATKEGGDSVTGYKRNRHGNAIKYVFAEKNPAAPKYHFAKERTFEINALVLQQLHDQARLHQMQLKQDPKRENGDLQLSMRDVDLVDA